MATVPPGLRPVPFDVAGTVAAIEACRRAAAAVDAAADVRQSAAEAARAEWRGPARDDFDVELAGVQREASALAGDLRSTAGSLQDAIDENRRENARRAEARHEWERSQATGG